MYEQEIGRVADQLPAVLSGVIDAESATEFEKLWTAGVGVLADRSDDKREFFRDTLLLTIKLNRRFAVGPVAGNRIRRIILDVFMDTSEPSISQSIDYSEPGSQINSASQLTGGEQFSAKHCVFIALLDELQKQFDTRFNVSGALKQELVNGLTQLSVSSRSMMVLERWATSDPFKGSFDKVSEDDMRLVVDLIYTFFCDEWGPADADDEVAKATASVESLPENRIFSLRQIL